MRKEQGGPCSQGQSVLHNTEELEEFGEGNSKNRGVGAVSLQPVRRNGLMTALRKAARFCGPCPFFTWHLSSPKQTSRTQCSRFSLPQWPPQCLACQAGVSNRLQVKKNQRFPGFLATAGPLARGGGGDRRRLADCRRSEKGPYSATITPDEFLKRTRVWLPL